MVEDRRMVPRLSLQMPVVLMLPRTDLRFNGRTRDLSSNGVFFYTDAPLTEQQEVDLLMTFSGELTSSPIQVLCHARVLRIERDPVAENTGVAVAIQNFDFLTGAGFDNPHFPFRSGE